VAVGTRVYMAPFDEHGVGVLDTVNLTFTTICTVHAGVTGPGKYDGAAAIDSRVFFAPYGSVPIGVVDTATNRFYTIAAASQFGGYSFAGAAALGPFVVFVPYSQDAIGILDNRTDMFYAVDMHGVSGPLKYQGGAAVMMPSLAKGAVFFAPFSQDGVGVVEVSENYMLNMTQRYEATPSTVDQAFSQAPVMVLQATGGAADTTPANRDDIDYFRRMRSLAALHLLWVFPVLFFVLCACAVSWWCFSSHRIHEEKEELYVAAQTKAERKGSKGEMLTVVDEEEVEEASLRLRYARAEAQAAGPAEGMRTTRLLR